MTEFHPYTDDNGMPEEVQIRASRAGIPKRFRSATLHQSVTGPMADMGREYVETFMAHDDGMILTGGTGIGKTHIACAVCNEIMRTWGMQTDIEVAFFNVNTDLPRLLDNRMFRRYDSYSATMRKILKADLLVVDDLLHAPDVEWAKEIFYQIYEARYSGELRTITTLNLNLEIGDDGYPDWSPVSETFNEPFMRRLADSTRNFLALT